jgi:hypothetical protein
LQAATANATRQLFASAANAIKIAVAKSALLLRQARFSRLVGAYRAAAAKSPPSIKRVLQRGDSSAEGVRLELEPLRQVVREHQASPPLPAREPEVEDLIDAYADPTLHPDIERIARMVTWRAYATGLCFASWTKKLAGWLKMEEGVLEAHLAEMEREELIRITPRGAGATPVIQFADGTLDALRIKKMRGITRQERTHPRVVRTFSLPAP